MNNEHIKHQLKKLRLSGAIEKLEQRLIQATEDNLTPQEFLELLLQDEIQKRGAKGLAGRLRQAQFEEHKTLEELQLDRFSSKLQRVIKELATNGYLKQHQHALIVGPTGTGKSHLAQALGHQACRQGCNVYFIHATHLLRKINASRADNSWERLFKKLLALDLLIIDDFGLKPLNPLDAEDIYIYELIAGRYLKKSIIVTSNRKIEAWVELFPDPVVANAALDRLTILSYQLALEGPSFRQFYRPNAYTDSTIAKTPGISRSPND